MRVYLGRIAFSIDAEHTDWHISQMFSDMIGDRIEWFSSNYPNLSIMRGMLQDPNTNQIVYDWYVDFHDPSGLMHYKLTYG